MHRISARPGGWDPSATGVIFVEQDPAPLVILTAADTDIQTLAQVQPQLPSHFPEVRVTNLLHLQQNISIDAYVQTVLSSAQGILIRLLGGKSYWSYGLETVKQMVQENGSLLIVLPGDDQPDWDLISHSTIGMRAVHQIWQYFLEGGVNNIEQGLKAFANCALKTDYPLQPIQVLPRVGVYQDRPISEENEQPVDHDWPGVGILFYRAHLLAGNIAPMDALCRALRERSLRPHCLYTYGLQEPDLMRQALTFWQGKIDVLLITTSFSLARLDQETVDLSLWQALDVPVLQVVLSGGSYEQWQESPQGLGSRDLAMNVVLPEVDGRVMTRAISFKSIQVGDPHLQTDVVVYQPQVDRVEFVADLAGHWVRLRRKSVAERRVALVLANYPCRDGRIANGVGLDTPASCVELLQAMQRAGYGVKDIPNSSDQLITHLTSGVTLDPIGRDYRPIRQALAPAIYQDFWTTLSPAIQTAIQQQWGDPPDQPIPIPGISYGQVFVGLQPSRGYDQDPSLSYHAPDLVPTHTYLAFYVWLRQVMGVDAVVHVGKHGNLEWLPGKSIALSEDCFPEIALGPLPHFYPFIVNDPGEGSQAKRRAQAVILDHLTPPLRRAHLYGSLLRLENLLDEYAQSQGLDPSRARLIQSQIQELVEQEQLVPSASSTAFPEWLPTLDGYLCELKEAQIRDGLHIFGRIPHPPQLLNLLLALARFPGGNQQGLTQAIAQDWGLAVDPLTADLGDPWPIHEPADSPTTLG
ncbi:MAG: cobaltochelatase subunit CobN [Cyanobacteriota bacterium]|nr:cobaltochelatase subunit CobN [Cyanobacteriota bacterium]